MSKTVISVENLTKSYQLGVIGGATLREDVNRWWAKIRGRQDPSIKIGDELKYQRKSGTIWALRDVSFQVKEGEILGIIGRNGAGKSTLLKILSQITAPTSGRAIITGRVGSLLEVGTGFHPELTGRENIFLNGTILGMSRKEISSKLEEIIEFANMAQFIDTPVKRYSSGMVVRLAFAVAAHLESEILIIDEVLAVGDAHFQKKCLGKIGEAAKSGRTVLFVSHNMGMITSLCTRALLLESGSSVVDGVPSEIVLSYFNSGNKKPHMINFQDNDQNIGDEFSTLVEAKIIDKNGNPAMEINIQDSFRVVMTFCLKQSVPIAPYANFHFMDAQGNCVFVSSGQSFSNSSGCEKGVYTAHCEVPGDLLNNNTYFIGLALTFTHQGIHVSFFEKDALSVNILDPLDETLNKNRHGYAGVIPGGVRPKLNWQIEKIR